MAAREQLPHPLSWKICVVTGLLNSAKKTELANALLYGDEVLWLPTSLRGLNFFHELAVHRRYTQGFFKPRARRDLECYRLLKKQILDGDLPITIPESFSEPLSLSDKRGADYFRTMKEEVLRFANTVKGENEEVLAHVQDTRACIIEPSSKYTLKSPPHWNPYHATQTLMQALSKVLLPDVSSLPLWEVAELKEKVKDELNPMRGELLRLTEDLRQMVKDECSEEEVAREAENIIKTRVESVLFEADRHVRDQLNKKWKKFLTQALKTIGLGGLGYVDLDFLKEAAKTGVEAVADVITVPGQPPLPTATAQFVLELRHLQQQRDTP